MPSPLTDFDWPCEFSIIKVLSSMGAMFGELQLAGGIDISSTSGSVCVEKERKGEKYTKNLSISCNRR